MATLKRVNTADWTLDYHTEIPKLKLWSKFMAFADSQKSSHTLWFFISLMVQGIFFLPIPAVLMYYYNAPLLVLAITMVCFFTSIIANMGGSGIRTTLTCFAISIMIHLVMIAVFII